MLAASGRASKSPSTTGGTVSGVPLHRQRGAPGLLALNLKRKGPVRFVVRHHQPPDRRFKLHDEGRAPRQTLPAHALQAAARREQFPGAREDWSADAVDHEVHRTDAAEVQHHLVGPQLLQPLAACSAADRGDDMGTRGCGELHSEGAHAPRRSSDEHAFSRGGTAGS